MGMIMLRSNIWILFSTLVFCFLCAISGISSQSACTECNYNQTCVPPNCMCCGDEKPFPFGKYEIPQMVFFTFDDAVTDQVAKFYRDLFDGSRKNPNGCPIAMTLFISHDNTVYDLVKEFYSKGMEIASHSVTHSHLDQSNFFNEAKSQKENLARLAGIPLEKIIGWRSPFLEPAGDTQPDTLKELGYTYDATLTFTKRNLKDKAPFPFTLDFGWPYDCKIKPCPHRRHYGFWEVPVVSLIDYKKSYDCVYVDGCMNAPPDEDSAFKFLWDNFQSYYTTNRAPFGINMHPSWFFYPERLKGMDRFIKELVKLDDVYIQTVGQVLEWLKKPTPLSRLHQFEPWRCEHSRQVSSQNGVGLLEIQLERHPQPKPQPNPWNTENEPEGQNTVDALTTNPSEQKFFAWGQSLLEQALNKQKPIMMEEQQFGFGNDVTLSPQLNHLEMSPQIFPSKTEMDIQNDMQTTIENLPKSTVIEPALQTRTDVENAVSLFANGMRNTIPNPSAIDEPSQSRVPDWGSSTDSQLQENVHIKSERDQANNQIALAELEAWQAEVEAHATNVNEKPISTSSGNQKENVMPQLPSEIVIVPTSNFGRETEMLTKPNPGPQLRRPIAQIPVVRTTHHRLQTQRGLQRRQPVVRTVQQTMPIQQRITQPQVWTDQQETRNTVSSTIAQQRELQRQQVQRVLRQQMQEQQRRQALLMARQQQLQQETARERERVLQQQQRQQQQQQQQQRRSQIQLQRRELMQRRRWEEARQRQRSAQLQSGSWQQRQIRPQMTTNNFAQQSTDPWQRFLTLLMGSEQ